MKEPIQEPGHTVSGSRLNIKEAKKRCEAAMPAPWRTRRKEDDAPNVDVMMGKTVIATMGDFYPEAEFVAHARSDLPAALEALEEAQGEIARLGTQTIIWASWLQMRTERDEAQGKLEAVQRVGEEYFRMGVGDVAYELRNAILRGTKEEK